MMAVLDRMMGSGVGYGMGGTGGVGLRLELEDKTDSQWEIFAESILVEAKLAAPEGQVDMKSSRVGAGGRCEMALAFSGASRALMICGDSPSVSGAEAVSNPLVSDDVTELVDCGLGLVA